MCDLIKITLYSMAVNTEHKPKAAILTRYFNALFYTLNLERNTYHHWICFDSNSSFI